MAMSQQQISTISNPLSAAVGPSVVEVRGVSKIFADGSNPVVALENLDLRIYRHEFVSLIGPSGCGKTTLLRLIADLTEPTSGVIYVNSKPPRQARLDRDFAVVFQNPILLPWRTVIENIQLPGEIFGDDQTSHKAEDLIELVGLEHFKDALPCHLSGGMQARVALARALSFTPSVLLMDEPFGALDEMTRDKMQLELLKIWSKTGTTILFITHSIPEAVFMGDRVLVMTKRPGRINYDIRVDFPRPRDVALHRNIKFVELVEDLREKLEE